MSRIFQNLAKEKKKKKQEILNVIDLETGTRNISFFFFLPNTFQFFFLFPEKVILICIHMRNPKKKGPLDYMSVLNVNGNAVGKKI
jgi:hypothetical protein